MFLRVFAVNAYDLSQAKIEKLQNGLTVMILEDHIQPLVSTQVLYKVGARNECDGTTGLAHFVEHMAFRATTHFPGTKVVSRIYEVGGEWHGYTWLDETTYFETVPVKDFDVVLQIQADRMNEALIKQEEVDIERGAVITELHSYENDPALVLNDLVNATSFLEHPYRNNTIGWLSDVQKITHDDLVNFYRKYYNPSNAVLAIAGDVNAQQVMQRVHRYFDGIRGRAIDSQPRTVEPEQNGERRVNVHGSGSMNNFQITYRAPSARDDDYGAFLLLQTILGGTSGVNFRQNEEGIAVKPGTRLDGVTEKLNTFFIPTADPYVFTLTGQVEPSVKTDEIEQRLETRIRGVRDTGVTQHEVDAARKALLSELIFDLETTEDAAHQMAYFEGIGAFGALQRLSQRISKIGPQDIQRVAQKYLQPYQRTIGWYFSKPVPSSKAGYDPGVIAVSSKPQLQLVKKLNNGTTLIVRNIRRSPTGFLRILMPSNTVESNADFTVDQPVWRYTSLNSRFLKEDLVATVQAAGTALKEVKPRQSEDKPSDDPETALTQTIRELLGARQNTGSVVPAAAILVGDIDPRRGIDLLEKAFRKLPQVKPIQSLPLEIRIKEKTVRIPGKAQSQLGYAIPAPPPSDPGSFAYRMLMYIMTHGYEGRLGVELIARTGLIYYVGSRYNSDGRTSWISMTAGVDPDKLKATRARFEEVMNDLREHPPTDDEVAEAKQNLIGRRLTAYQSNEELSAFYAQEFVEQGGLLTQSEFEQRVRAVTPEQVRAIVPKFLDGVTAVVDTN